MAGAALDIKLERILAKFFLDGSNSKKLINSALGRFATRIDMCFALGIISADDRNDLHIIKEIRNAFAHNLFGCDFSNPQVEKELHKLVLARKAGATPEAAGNRVFFNIEVLTMDTQLDQRYIQVKPVTEPQRIYINGK